MEMDRVTAGENDKIMPFRPSQPVYCITSAWCRGYVDLSVYVVDTVTKGFVSRHVLTPYKAAVGSQPDLLSWTDPPPKYSEEPPTNELLSLLDPFSASSNQLPSPMAVKSAGLADNDSYVSCISTGSSSSCISVSCSSGSNSSSNSSKGRGWRNGENTPR